MPNRLFYLPIVATLATAACASVDTGVVREQVAVSRVPSLTPTSRVFHPEQIARTGAHTAWDAVRLLVPRYHLDAASISFPRFGATGISARESPLRVIIDGHIIDDLAALQMIPASDLLAIHVLSAAEAAWYVGGSGRSDRPALFIQTRQAMRAPRVR